MLKIFKSKVIVSAVLSIILFMLQHFGVLELPLMLYAPLLSAGIIWDYKKYMESKEQDDKLYTKDSVRRKKSIFKRLLNN